MPCLSESNETIEKHDDQYDKNDPNDLIFDNSGGCKKQSLVNMTFECFSH